jgi:cellobiose phosphorylase
MRQDRRAEAHLDRLAAKARRNLTQRKSPRVGFTRAEAEALATRYSTFESTRDGEGFLVDGQLAIHRPDTPRPWLHLMTSNHDSVYGVMGSFWEATGLGFLCYETVLAGPVTSHHDPSYVPTAPRTTDVREFFLREEMGKQALVWHMLPQVGRDADQYSDYECRYGLGWVSVESARNGIHSELRVFVPVDDPCEVWTIRLTNLTGRRRKLQLFTRVNWGLETHPSYYFDPRVVSEGQHLQNLRALVALNNDKGNALPRTGFMMSSAAFQGYDLSGEAFTGGGHYRFFPRAVMEGKCRNSIGRQPYLGLVGALQYSMTIAAGASKTIHILVGTTSREPARRRRHLAALRRRLLGVGGVDREFARLGASWHRMLTRVALRSPDEEVDRVYNIWLKYQQHNTARLTRALDQVGYRDVLQDLLGLCNFNPEFVRAFLPIALNHQLADGRAIRQFFKYPGTKAPNDERMYADSSVWIADTLVTYLEETGDFDILDKQVGFYDLGTHRQDNTTKRSVYEHALLAVKGIYRNRGQRGLCLIGHGDWNDALDGLSKRGQGVSTWLSIALIYAAERLLKLARHLEDGKNARLMEEIIAIMTEAVNDAAWDDDHYVFGFNDDGLAIGTNASEEGRMHATVNAWALFTGVAAAAGREEKLLEAFQRLWSPVGTVLIHPPYTHKSREIAGRIADITPGQFENGAIYTHGHSFFLYGLVCRGYREMAYSELRLSLPGNTFLDVSTGPPHQQSNFAVGPSHPDFGTNLYSNFSGSTAWYLRTIDRMVGVLADFDGLRVSPAAPSAWKEYQLRKQFRGIIYHFRFHHHSGRSQVKSVTIDGKPLAPVAGEWKITLPGRRPKRSTHVEVVL